MLLLLRFGQRDHLMFCLLLVAKLINEGGKNEIVNILCVKSDNSKIRIS